MKFLRIIARASVVFGAVLLLAGLGQFYLQWRAEANLGPPQPGTGIVLAITAEAPATLPDFSTPGGVRLPGADLTFSGSLTDTLPLKSITPDDNLSSRLARRILHAGPLPATSPPTRIVIPAIHVDSKVLEMGWKVTRANGQTTTEWDVPGYAVGWAKNSALPGNGSNVVMSGHNNIQGEVFRDLSELKPGDLATVYVADVAYPYKVEEKYIVREAGMPLEVRLKNAQWMQPTPDERLTLISCWPYWTNTHRVIIVARPIQKGG